MKKQMKLLAISLIILCNIFNFANRKLFQPVNATYVEGPITQDTIWTLVNSPFMLSNNVTVYPYATLTIESGVEVRFGENFCLVINGRIIADGVEDKPIRFTSNKLTPMKGDWGTIQINGAQPSLFAHCIIEYGTNGITLDAGSLSILDSIVKSNSENGITINNGNVIIENNEITSNSMSGIYIAGGSQITIRNNVISSNGDGIFLTGYLTGEIDIEQNSILLNGQSGIVLEADAYDNTVIINNDISANLNGFRISTGTSTYITRNYISNNMVGIYYEDGINHEAHFNDIYDNNLGMDVSHTATVDATYNYWGHRSGPLHESLNPHGKGNPVGGNGVNIDFIFFLSKPIDYENEKPQAVLWTDKTLVAPNQDVTFIGADSYDDGRVDKYFFDFGDGTNSGWITLPLFDHSYSSTGTYISSLRVVDDFNVTSENIVTETISVQNLTPLEVSISLSNSTVNSNEEILVTVYVSNGTGAIENANVTLFSVKGGDFAPQSGVTDSAGYFTTTFTAPNATELSNIRIIVRATKTGYADGSNYEHLKVLPAPKVQVVAEPATVKSEETASVTVYVTGSFEEPIADAALLLSVDYGSLSATTGVTDLNGMAVFVFIAPQTTLIDGLNATITVIASKSGYTTGEGYAIINIKPKVLDIQVTADPNETVSEGKINVTVHVSYDLMHISEANVTIMSEDLPTTSGLTNPSGDAIFTLTAPPVNAPHDLTIIARASKIGYADGENILNVTINPGILEVTVVANPSTVASREAALVTVHVTCNATSVANASITLSSSQGSLSATTGLTDSNGYCTFTFSAPRTSEEIPQVIVIANATKNGYISAENQTTITVTAEVGGGWSLTTILLILIPVVIVAMVAILIKLKVIVLSAKEE